MLNRSTSKPRLGTDHPSLQGRVAAEIRQAILTGDLKPGERLIEERLAEELGVSRNPVREAIRTLASEGLIEVNARRGASVFKLSEREARETIEVRALLEGHNARLAARRQDTETIKRIERVLNAGTRAVAAGRFDQLSDLNQEFHRELYAASRNTVLGDVLQKLRERTAMLFSPTNPARQARLWDEHAAILRAIIDGDERTAATLAAEHVTRAGIDYLFQLDTSQDNLSFLPIDGASAAARGHPSKPAPSTKRKRKRAK